MTHSLLTHPTDRSADVTPEPEQTERGGTALIAALSAASAVAPTLLFGGSVLLAVFAAVLILLCVTVAGLLI